MWNKVFLLLIIFSVSMLAFALDDEGNPNDPSINDRANACYEDGSMANKCDTDWEWTCGWYMIRFDYALLSREEVPAFCAVLLGAEPEILDTSTGGSVSNIPPAGCYPWGTAFGVWLGSQVQTGVDISGLSNCSFSSTFPGTYVSFADLAAASNYCANNGFSSATEVVSSAVTGAWAIYQCV